MINGPRWLELLRIGWFVSYLANSDDLEIIPIDSVLKSCQPTCCQTGFRSSKDWKRKKRRIGRKRRERGRGKSNKIWERRDREEDEGGWKSWAGRRAPKERKQKIYINLFAARLLVTVCLISTSLAATLQSLSSMLIYKL